MYDFSCRFCCSRMAGKHWSPLAASLAYPAMKFIVDKFHSRAHVDEWCVKHTSPKAPENAEDANNINTSICEITFAWLARCRHMTRKMAQWTFWFFVQEIIHGRNVDLLRKAGIWAPLSSLDPASPTSSASPERSSLEMSSSASSSS